LTLLGWKFFVGVVRWVTRAPRAVVGGGTAAVCDEAEAVIDEMHEALEREFEVQTGELLWADKDPNRILRSADELPRSADADRQGETQ